MDKGGPLHFCSLEHSLRKNLIRGNFDLKRGVRCERFDRTPSVVLKTLATGFYRTVSGAKGGSMEPF